MAGFSLIKIITDTNIIHASQAHLLIPAKVSQYISEHKIIESVDLKWLLPQMVVNERRHQMLEASKNLVPKLTQLESLLGHSLGINEEVMADRIDSKIRKTIGDLGIEVCDVDTSEIDWNEVIDRSAKRKPPFEISGEKEKGFRDAIIAETFLQEVSRSPATPRSCLLVLISGDKRLREYIEEKTSSSKNVRILDTLDELKSLLNAIASEITEEFLSELSPKAKKCFWDFDKKEGLYSKGEVFVKINEKFSDEMTSITTFYPETRRKGDGITLGDQTFIRKTGQTVVWSRELIVKSQIVKGGLGSLGLATLLNTTPDKAVSVSTEEQIVSNVESAFAVEWQHQITTKGNISKPKINSIEFTGHSFDPDK